MDGAYPWCRRDDNISSAGGLATGDLKSGLQPSRSSGWRGGSWIVLLEGPKVSRKGFGIGSFGQVVADVGAT